MRKILALLLFVTAISSVEAQSFNANGKITRLHFWEGHSGLLIRHEDMINKEGCSRIDNYILRKEHPFFREFYSLLLAAHIAGQPVKFGLRGCREGFPSVVHVFSDK